MPALLQPNECLEVLKGDAGAAFIDRADGDSPHSDDELPVKPTLRAADDRDLGQLMGAPAAATEQIRLVSPV